MPNTRKTEVRQEANGAANDVASGVMKVDSVTNLSPLPSIEKVASFGLTPNPSGVPPVNPAVTASGLATSASPSMDPPAAKPVDSGVTSSGATGSDANALGSGFRPIKRSRLNSENHDKDVIVRDFEGVDLAGISRRFPQEKRVQLAQKIDDRAEKVAGAWAALLLAQTGMRYAEWATTASRVEQTKQNTLRIVKAIVDYLTTASQAKLRQCISYIVAKRRRQGFGHEEVITSMLLLRRSFEKGCGPVDGEAGFLIDAVTRVMVGEVATYLHAINPHEESQLDVCVATEDDDELGVEHPEDLNLPPQRHLQQELEDVRPPMHLFIVPKVPAQYVRAREGGTPIMLAPLWSRAAHEPSGLWTWPRGTEPLVGAIVNNRFVVEAYIASGS